MRRKEANNRIRSRREITRRNGGKNEHSDSKNNCCPRLFLRYRHLSTLFGLQLIWIIPNQKATQCSPSRLSQSVRWPVLARLTDSVGHRSMIDTIPTNKNIYRNRYDFDIWCIDAFGAGMKNTWNARGGGKKQVRYILYIRKCILLCKKWPFFPGIVHFSRSAAGLFSSFLLRGMEGARVYTTAQTRAPAEVRGACSGPSKSRILAYDYGESFRPARAKQDNGDPTI